MFNINTNICKVCESIVKYYNSKDSILEGYCKVLYGKIPKSKIDILEFNILNHIKNDDCACFYIKAKIPKLHNFINNTVNNITGIHCCDKCDDIENECKYCKHIIDVKTIVDNKLILPYSYFEKHIAINRNELVYRLINYHIIDSDCECKYIISKDISLQKYIITHLLQKPSNNLYDKKLSLIQYYNKCREADRLTMCSKNQAPFNDCIKCVELVEDLFDLDNFTESSYVNNKPLRDKILRDFYKNEARYHIKNCNDKGGYFYKKMLEVYKIF